MSCSGSGTGAVVSSQTSMTWLLLASISNSTTDKARVVEQPVDRGMARSYVTTEMRDRQLGTSIR